MSKKIIILSLLAVFMIGSGFGCKSNSSTQSSSQSVTLNFWSVYDDSDAFDDIIAKYKTLHPYVKIEYKKLRYEEYEDALLNAMAEDRGPDIFAIQSTWIQKYRSKLTPLPDTVTLTYPVTTGTIQKQTVYQKKTEKTLTVKDLKNQFVDVVANDVVLDDGKIYGLPLSVDTLAMYYNKDLLNNAGISQPPTYWDNDFIQDVKKLTKQDVSKNIVQSGTALGGSTNIDRYPDILSALMMQSGATMIDGSGKATFNAYVQSANGSYNPGTDALRFYTDFSNPNKESYSWNSKLDNSLTMFANGQLAIMFGYSYDLDTIRSQAPKLNFGIAALPQIQGNPSANVANYWVYSVSKKSANVNEAWDFIEFMTKEEQAKSYLEKTKRPTALRSLIDTQKEDEDLNVFASQLLTAKNWYRGKDVKSAEDAFAQMIDQAIADDGSHLQSIVDNGASKVQQTIDQ